MPCFTAPIDDNEQLLAIVLVSAHTMGYADVEAAVHGRADSAGVQKCRALLDTGAGMSCITEDIAKFLKLDIQGSRGIQSVSEKTRANLYRVNIHIPIAKEIVIDGEISEGVEIIPWLDAPVFGLPISSTYDVLLGIDFIRRGALHVSGRQFTFCI